MDSINHTPPQQEKSLAESTQLRAQNAKTEAQIQKFSLEKRTEYDSKRASLEQNYQQNRQEIIATCQGDCQNLQESLLTPEQEREIQEFLESYEDIKMMIEFFELPSFIQTDIRVIEKFAEYNAQNTTANTFRFQDIPDTFYAEHIRTTNGIASLLSLSKNDDQYHNILTRIGEYPVSPDKMQQALNIFQKSSGHLSVQQEKLVQNITEMNSNPIVITAENIETYRQRLQDSNISQEERENILHALRRFSPQEAEAFIKNLAPPGHIYSQISINPTHPKQNPLFAETPSARNFAEAAGSITSRTGIQLNLNSTEKDEKGNIIIFDNGIFRVLESPEGSMVMTDSFGYDLKFDKNSVAEMNEFVETVERMNHATKVGVGYFGKDVLNIFRIISAHSHLPGVPSLSLPPENPHFIDILQLNDTIQVLQKIGYNPTGRDATYGSMNIEQVSDFQSYETLQKLGGDNFYANNTFRPDILTHLLQKTYSTQNTPSHASAIA